MRPLALVLGISLVAGPGARAQETSSQLNWTRAGIGIAFVAATPVGRLTGTSTVYVPVPMSPTFRLEPVIGWHHTSFLDSTNTATSPNNGLSGSTSAFLLGLGLFGTRRPGQGGTLLYYGPRLGLAWASTNVADRSSDSLSASQTYFFVSGVLGGEHRIGHLSVGGEIGLSYLHIGAPSFQQAGTGFTVTVAGGSSVGTDGAAFVRWYF